MHGSGDAELREEIALEFGFCPAVLFGMTSKVSALVGINEWVIFGFGMASGFGLGFGLGVQEFSDDGFIERDAR